MEHDLHSHSRPPAHRLLLHAPDPADTKAEALYMSVELSARRTGMSFQRTRMSADRTLMSVMRTALSLITFGFTIFHGFQQLHAAKLATNVHAPQRFSAALAVLGICMLVFGIGYQISFMRELRAERRRMQEAGLVHGETQYPISLSLLVALALFVIGILAFLSILFNRGPFG